MDNKNIYQKIITSFNKKQSRFTIHCLERCFERLIEIEEVENAISNGEIIEYYLEDKYGPSCLILGYTKQKRPLHIQCSIDPVWVVTCYDPSENKGKWCADFKKRIKK